MANNNDKLNSDEGVSGCTTKCTIKAGWKCAKNQDEYMKMISNSEIGATPTVNSELDFGSLIQILLLGSSELITKTNISNFPRFSSAQAEQACINSNYGSGSMAQMVENRCAQYALDVVKFKDLNLNNFIRAYLSSPNSKITTTAGGVAETINTICKDGIVNYDGIKLTVNPKYKPNC